MTERAPVPRATDVDIRPTSPVAIVERMQRDSFLRTNGINPKGPFQLEIWPDTVRETPNDFARAALFTVRNKTEPRANLRNAVLFHTEKAVRITFTGTELRADDDELVWLQILEYAKQQPLGEPIEFNIHKICLAIGMKPNGRNYRLIRDCITRLKANELSVENPRIGRGVALSLIREYEFCGTTGTRSQYRVWIHPNLIMLFAGRNSTRLTWVTYRTLKPIARRLYDYAASHKKPFPLRLDTFRQMCASTCSTQKTWRRMVSEACKALVASNLLENAWVRDDCVHFER